MKAKRLFIQSLIGGQSSGTSLVLGRDSESVQKFYSEERVKASGWRLSVCKWKWDGLCDGLGRMAGLVQSALSQVGKRGRDREVGHCWRSCTAVEQAVCLSGLLTWIRVLLSEPIWSSPGCVFSLLGLCVAHSLAWEKFTNSRKATIPFLRARHHVHCIMRVSGPFCSCVIVVATLRRVHLCRSI